MRRPYRKAPKARQTRLVDGEKLSVIAAKTSALATKGHLTEMDLSKT